MSNTQDEFSYFQTGSGLPLDGALAQVVAAESTVNNSYAAGATVVKITYQPYDELSSPIGDPQSQLYSCGKNWEVLDRGAAVGHTSGKQVRFNNQSNYGRLIDACFDPTIGMPGQADLIAECQARQLQPNTMAMWVGLWFELHSLAFPKQGETVATQTGSTIVPKAFRGVSEVAGYVAQTQAPAGPGPVAARPGPAAARPGPAAPAPAPVSAPAAPAAAGRTMPPRPGATTAAPAAPPAPPAAPAPATVPAKKAPAKAAAPKPAAPAAPAFTVDADGVAHVEGVDDAVVYEVVVKATENNDFEAFMVDAMSVPGVAGNNVMERALMSQAEGSLWATYHG